MFCACFCASFPDRFLVGSFASRRLFYLALYVVFLGNTNERDEDTKRYYFFRYLVFTGVCELGRCLVVLLGCLLYYILFVCFAFVCCFCSDLDFDVHTSPPPFCNRGSVYACHFLFYCCVAFRLWISRSVHFGAMAEFVLGSVCLLTSSSLFYL